MTTVPVSHYQSFTPGSGSSDSFGKLEALKFPDMTGKRFLDLGCNHGFFCFAALERGAAEVTGVDRDPKAIEAATARAAEKGVSAKTRFINKSWDEFDEGGFDFIILLSALHYAKDQAAFLRKIAGMLNPGGMLILEGGAINNPRNNWTSIIRGKPPHTDMVEYPTPRHMFDILSESFAPREIGKSVMQPGDMIPRYVWHCPKLKQMVLTIAGPSRGGKTTLGFSLQDKGLRLIDIDVLIGTEKAAGSELGKLIEPVYKIGQLHRCFDAIQKAGRFDLLADRLVGEIRRASVADAKTTAVMGVVLANPNFMKELRERAKAADIVLWEATRTI